jgi:flagellar basal body P-ring formation protein FlgA
LTAVRVSRKARTLDELEFRDMLFECLGKSFDPSQGELIMRLGRPWTPIKVPHEAIELRPLDLPVNGLRSSFVVRFEIRCGRESIGTWQMPVQVQLYRQVWIARVPLKRGQVLSETEVLLEKRDVLGLRDPLAQWNPGDDDFECAEYIPSGAPLLARSVRARSVVHRGDVVEALLQDGLMTIALKVEALEEGSPGQVVRVRNLQSRRELRGKVQNEQTILITL